MHRAKADELDCCTLFIILGMLETNCCSLKGSRVILLDGSKVKTRQSKQDQDHTRKGPRTHDSWQLLSPGPVLDTGANGVHLWILA